MPKRYNKYPSPCPRFVAILIGNCGFELPVLCWYKFHILYLFRKVRCWWWLWKEVWQLYVNRSNQHCLKMISSPYCAVSEPNVYKHCKRLTRWNANQCYLLRITYLICETFQTLSNSFIDFCSCEGFHQVIYQKEWRLRIEHGSWHKVWIYFM